MASRAIAFLYKNTIEVTTLEGQRINMPFYRKDIKVFKGVSNAIHFQLKNSDSKPVKITHGTIKMFIFDEETDEVVLTKYATIEDEIKGKYIVTVQAGDILTHKPGYYRYSLVYTDYEEVEQMLYTDFAQNATGKIEFIDNAFPKTVPATVVATADFKWQGPLPSDITKQLYISGRYQGDAFTNSQDGLHTIALYLTNFTGTFVVQGSLEDYPTAESEFFNIPLDGLTPFVNTSGIQNFNFEGSFVWIRFKYITDAANVGTVDKLLYKN